MARPRTKRQNAGRTGVHVTLDADLAARLRAFAGFHGRELGDVVAEGLRTVMRGFSARQDIPAGPRLAGGPAGGRAEVQAEAEADPGPVSSIA